MKIALKLCILFAYETAFCEANLIKLGIRTLIFVSSTPFVKKGKFLF